VKSQICACTGSHSKTTQADAPSFSSLFGHSPATWVVFPPLLPGR